MQGHQQVSDQLKHLLGLCNWFDKRQTFSHLLIRLVLCLSEEADVLDESGLDVFVVHELAEDVKLLAQELVGEIHLVKAERTHVQQVSPKKKTYYGQKNKKKKKKAPLPRL